MQRVKRDYMLPATTNLLSHLCVSGGREQFLHCILINCVSLHGSKDNNHNISATTMLSNACHSLICSNNIALQQKHAQQKSSLFY